mmetsp:Transcript_39875/g.127790  ORF Transcript_39875/g.127790 Transcript_39875/m.127790 type:complete len:96 (+) Transcript_39875:79-366(+)
MNGDSGGTAAMTESGTQCGPSTPMLASASVQTQAPARPALAETATVTDGVPSAHKETQTPPRSGSSIGGQLRWEYVAGVTLLVTAIIALVQYKRR